MCTLLKLSSTVAVVFHVYYFFYYLFSIRQMNFFSSDFNHEWSWKFFRTGLISNIFQIKYNWIFQNQKLSKMTSNVNGTSIMIHMRLTACRLDTCATSGRCYVRFYSFTNFIKHIDSFLFNFMIVQIGFGWLVNMKVAVSDDERLLVLKYL